MKKIISFVLVCCCMLACGTRDYRITGVCDGAPGSIVYLITLGSGKRDTLASVETVNGRFELEGKINRKMAVSLEVAQSRGGKGYCSVDVPLEAGDHVVYLSSGKNASVIFEDGQKIATEFYHNEKYLMDQRDSLFKSYLKASDSGRDSIGRLFVKVVDVYETRETDLVKRYPDSLVTACMLTSCFRVYEQRLRKYDYALGSHVSSPELELRGWKSVKERYAALGERAGSWLKERIPDERFARVDYGMRQLAAEVTTSEGKTAPDFTLTDPTGNTFSLYGIKGKLRLIDFWASWCEPCGHENVHVAKVYDKYHAKGFEVISISLDTNKKKWMEAIARDKLVWKYHGTDDGPLALLYGVTGVPCTLLLDENNVIVVRNPGGDYLDKIVVERLK